MMTRLLCLSLLFAVPVLEGAEPVLLAFPGAEGAGRFATGGRGGEVLLVTNLDDAGPGSLRAAVEQAGPRTVLFNVSGTIELQSPLIVREGDLTIAGQTAPGDGICLAGHPFELSADNVVVRFLRVRLGDVHEQAAAAFRCVGRDRIMVDHCSFSWGLDECATARDNTRFTMQWCILSESLNHPEPPHEARGYGGTWGGQDVSFHHNLLAHHTSRSPRFDGARGQSAPWRELVDFRGNVIYNWRNNSSYGGEASELDGSPAAYNLVGNTYQSGPATRGRKQRFRILQPSVQEAFPGVWSRFFLDQNRVVGFPPVTEDNWAGGVQGVDAESIVRLRAGEPFAVSAPLPQEPAEIAYARVLAEAGALQPRRDAVDTRIVWEVRTGTARFGELGIIASQDDVGGWPLLRSAPPGADTDGDGLPDEWERLWRLDPADPSDTWVSDPASGFPWLEVYLHERAQGSSAGV